MYSKINLQIKMSNEHNKNVEGYKYRFKYRKSKNYHNSTDS